MSCSRVQGYIALGDTGLPESKRFTQGQTQYHNGRGQVVPIEDQVTGTRGFGRYRTVQGANFLFITQVDGDLPETQRDSKGDPLPADEKVPAASVRMQAAFIPQLYDVALGSIFNMPRFRLQITGLDQFEVNGIKLGFPALIAPQAVYDSYVRDGAAFGEQFGPRQFLAGPEVRQFVSNAIEIFKEHRRGAGRAFQVRASNGDI